jgi:hypothetical protein
MGAPPQCPGCGTNLQPDMESCPNCPMSFHDAPPEKTALQNDTFRTFGIPIIIFGGLAGALWWYSTTMWKAVSAGVEDQPISAAPAKPAKSEDGMSVSAVIQAKVDELAEKPGGTGEAPTAGAAFEADEEEGAGVISVMKGHGPSAKVVTEWKMRGVIYDLLTLKPVPAARLIFSDSETNMRAVIQTDGSGRYRAILPPLPGRGYVVTIAKAGYASSYLNPGTEGVAEMSAASRRELVKELSSLIAEPASLEPHSHTPLVTDFHLAPK